MEIVVFKNTETSQEIIQNTPSLVQQMAGRQKGVKPLSEPMVTWFLGAYVHHSASVT